MAIGSSRATGRNVMKPFSLGSIAVVALSLWAIGHFAHIADVVRDRSEGSSSQTAASTTAPSVERVAARIQTRDPGLPASYLDGVRILHAAAPSSGPEAAADGTPERQRNRTVSMNE